MKASLHTALLLAAVVCFVAVPAARATVVFDQTPGAISTAFWSDLDFDADGRQIADEFTLGSAATVRSALWRGVYISGNSPTAPLDFTLFIYGDSGGLPDQSPGGILSETDVSFTLAEITDTGEDFTGFDIYEFAADINPVALSSGTNYWFSVLADTANDTDDIFRWLSGFNDGAPWAVQDNVTGMGGFSALGNLEFYFQLNDTVLPVVVPVPAAAWIALPLLGGLGVTQWRKRRNIG